MNLSPIVAATVLSASAGFSAEFHNLDFESANTNNLSRIFTVDLNSGFSSFGEMFPGWQVRARNAAGPIKDGWLNIQGTGDGFVSLFDANNRLTLQGRDRFPVFGKFSFGMNPTDQSPFSLLQVGEIPASASEISFINFDLPVSVFINNQAVALNSMEIPVDPSIAMPRSRVTADISEFAGKEVELRFTVTWNGSGHFGGFDNIEFLSVPEPSTLALFACGAAAILGNCFRQKKANAKPM